MAIFKVLCLIGFVLLSSGYARKHRVRHGSFRHHHDFHRYMHIFKRHLGADGISRKGAGSKRSERVEESSHRVWQQNRNRKQIPLVKSEDGSHEVVQPGSKKSGKDKGNGKDENPNRPNEINVITLGTKTTAPEKAGSKEVGKEKLNEAGKVGSNEIGKVGSNEAGKVGSNEAGKVGSNEIGNGGIKEPEEGSSNKPESGESTQPVNGGGLSEPANGGPSEGGNQGES